jgi:hypothetical protein
VLNVIFSLDYEIHGNGDGCPNDLMVEPTNRLLNLLDRYGAKLTIMADIAEILKFREYKEQNGRDDYHYEAIIGQLKDAVRRGHDVQLHLHCSYFNARHENGKWQQDWSEYNFAGLSRERISEVLRIGKTFLEEQLQPVDPNYRCYAFRAANWSVSPSRNVVRALIENDFEIESSVFKYGHRSGLVNFDYSSAPSNLVPWFADEEDICRRNDSSNLLEVPIYCEDRYLPAFISPNRIYRALSGRAHRLDYSGNGQADSGQRRSSKLSSAFHRHAWKADFNQCTGRQLIGALNRAAASHPHDGRSFPFVLIGHSKLFTRQNERSLRTFLQFVRSKPEAFRFSTYEVCRNSQRKPNLLAAGAAT